MSVLNNPEVQQYIEEVAQGLPDERSRASVIRGLKKFIDTEYSDDITPTQVDLMRDIGVPDDLIKQIEQGKKSIKINSKLKIRIRPKLTKKQKIAYGTIGMILALVVVFASILLAKYIDASNGHYEDQVVIIASVEETKNNE